MSADAGPTSVDVWDLAFSHSMGAIGFATSLGSAMGTALLMLFLLILLRWEKLGERDGEAVVEGPTLGKNRLRVSCPLNTSFRTGSWIASAILVTKEVALLNDDGLG